jgi:hypothetical protein
MCALSRTAVCCSCGVTSGAVRRRRDDDKDALDVRLGLPKPLADKNTGTPLEIENLTCILQLRIRGVRVDQALGSRDDVLVLPTTTAGARDVRATVFDRAGRAKWRRSARSVDS